MKRLSLSGWGLLLMLPAGVARAELVCPESTATLGQVSSGSVLAQRFLLVNRGSHPIEVTEVKPGCGCLRPRLDHPTIRPGEQTSLTLEINTLTQAPGPNLWRAVVHYRENNQPAELILAVRAQVTAVVSVQPASLLIHTQTAARGSFILSDRLERGLTVCSLSTFSPHVRATCGKAEREGDVWKRTISLEVLASMPEGRHEDVLKIATSDSRYAALSVPFTVIKRSADIVQASPASLNLLAQQSVPLASRIVMLDAGDKAVLVERIETSHPFIACTWASGPGPRATLRVQFDPDKLPPEKRFDGQVRIHVRQPAPQVVTIPIHCVTP